ncbi:Nramp family divalent metal transporter [Kineococcus glutinatus]|uniref:Nramp family divalent metal transporter n=1 Tax=Kineococcus glutinatus TaxID=1070872 RepID=A0ABP9HP44_9ACTN
MSSSVAHPQSDTGRRRWRLVGPGVVAAATGVGAGDLVATLVAGGEYGYALLWAGVLGTVLKISLAEAVGRYHLATGSTVFAGWRSLGSWTTVYFACYVVVWGFVYGAAAMTSSALPLAALFEGLDLRTWAVLSGLVGLAFVWFGRYGVFEKVMTACVGVMFVTVVGLAVLVVPDVPALLGGLRPRLPEGSALYTLGLVGGVGGTITMAAYGYWINAKGWRDASWMRVMRWDNRVAYLTTGLFVLAMLVVGAELLHAGGIALASGDRGLLDLDAVLRERFGPVVSTLFLVGFFATAFSSLLGVWHGVSLVVADFVANLRRPMGQEAAERVAGGGAERSWPFRAYLLWLTFPPMGLLFLDRPFALVVAYGVLGAFFMPFLAGTLLWLLNGSRTPAEHRSGPVSNVALTLAALLFVVLCADQVRELLA